MRLYTQARQAEQVPSIQTIGMYNSIIGWFPALSRCLRPPWRVHVLLEGPPLLMHGTPNSNGNLPGNCDRACLGVYSLQAQR